MDVGGLFADDEFAKELGRSDGVAEAESRRDDLGEASEVDYAASGIKRLDGGTGSPL